MYNVNVSYLPKYLHVSSWVLIKYEIDIHVRYNLLYNFFYQNYISVLFLVINFTKNKLEKGISITSQFYEFQNISVEESDGCQYDSIVISDTKNVSLDRSARLCGLYHQQDPTSLQKR